MAKRKIELIQIPTPIQVDRLAFWLEGYDTQKKLFLLEGFKNGFKIGFQGSVNNAIPNNLKSASEMPNLVSEHIQKELLAGRIAGPFVSPPFTKFQCSPVGLVEKKDSGKFRMIHHLSYPEGSSVNDQIDPGWTAVQYATISDAIELVVNLCPQAFMSKTDVKSAFRVIPLHPDVRHLFVFHWEDYFYVDLALPMGCSSSCQIFEALSTAVEWIAKEKLHIKLVHILDDFFLTSVSKQVGIFQLKTFLDMCRDIGLPMAPEKTFQPDTVMTFVGYEIDTLKGEVRLPLDKLKKCTAEINIMISKQKATLREIQSIVGLLNFACAVVLPGRAFLRRMIDLTLNLKAPYHHTRLTLEAKADLLTWLTFLSNFNGKSIFPENSVTSTHDIHLFTDASGTIGYGAIFGKDWFNGKWSDWWIQQSIALKELYPIVLAVETWGHMLCNKRLILHTDNSALVPIITNQTSKNPLIMILVRRLVLKCLSCNIILSAEHIAGAKNSIADALSRFQMERFRILAPHAVSNATSIPPLPKMM